MAWTDKIMRIWKIRDLRMSVLYILGMLVVFRVVAHIPIPGIDTAALKSFFGSSQLLGLLNVFSGGTIENFSIGALGVAPYITASIIFQLLTMIIPRLEELSKEGEYGQRKINQYTRLLSVPLAFVQAYGLVTLLRRSSALILPNLSALGMMQILIIMTAGTVFLMWIGELISERKMGNGISIMIFAGIIAALPQAVQRTILSFDPTQTTTLLAFIIIALITVVGIVLITEAQRNVPVAYARRVRGMRMVGGVNTHLPLRVNMAGVIPIIFAISIVLFPPLIAQFFLGARTPFITTTAQWIIDLFQNQLFYGIAYFVLVVGFTFFYTAVIFHPDRIAENLQKQGGFIPGIRPGVPTASYLSYTLNRILLVGALFLGIIAILPIVVQQITHLQTLVIGGTSLLIVVSVVIEIVKQVDAQLTMREYEGL